MLTQPSSGGGGGGDGGGGMGGVFYWRKVNKKRGEGRGELSLWGQEQPKRKER